MLIMPMSMRATVLFERPQNELASLLNERIGRASAVHIVAGFVTPEGIRALDNTLSANPPILKSLIVGSGNYKAFEAIDRLIGYGVSFANIFVHLGHTRLTSSSAKHRFFRHH